MTIFRQGGDRYAVCYSLSVASFSKIIIFKNLDFHIFLQNGYLQVHGPPIRLPYNFTPCLFDPTESVILFEYSMVLHN